MCILCFFFFFFFYRPENAIGFFLSRASERARLGSSRSSRIIIHNYNYIYTCYICVLYI